MTRLFLVDGLATEPLDPERVGAKAANLGEMARLGLAVPPAFVILVDLCADVASGRKKALAQLDERLAEGIAFLEARTGRRFGDRRRPLLVSVRSGAARSMPGMLETVLDVGADETTAAGLVRLTGNPRFALDCRRRLLEAYAETVLGLDPRPLAADLAERVAAEGVASDRDLDVEALADHVGRCLLHTQGRVPDDPMAQLRAAARAVFASWGSDKAVAYRRIHGLDDLAGTAVTVQAMVYGNADGRSGAGVAFSRDPSTGAREPVVEVLFEAQGEDVVSGRRTPLDARAFERRMPAVTAELIQALDRLERRWCDVQDVEFTIEAGRLWILQTRAAKRTPRAALTIAIALVEEGLISPDEALDRLKDVDEDALDATGFLGAAPALAVGVAASPGVACGRIACDGETARRMAESGDPVVLVRPDTSTADVIGFSVAAGILTASGGRTAHAALVARQMGRPCIVGCAALRVDETRRRVTLGEVELSEGDWLSLDADAGTIHRGRRDIVRTRPEAEIAVWQGWKAARKAEHAHAGKHRKARGEEAPAS
ncbi:pyruvate, phosphate dikinase [Pinisolibacter aquiterrae]|uniref:pyruvate, phosphate dikinase n=1 Tax=Pinisolibacter aquiterrae TaxID=2815579 RepID=UPI001C3D104F|nr:pyruvate, phosphate dikinase [Pinisolibacter aquiterrae]MBV5265179.1 pyruvate, phosphate dikinase [Pinisolibacter aquiterrae]MCC8235491.1 pyruvate, phosphate dikinase [Pinisolibacter aquiterrae]